MCGLVGVLCYGAYGIGFKERQVFRDLLVADSVRGEDGTGVFIVDSKKDVRILKKELNPFRLLQDKQWDPFFDPPYSQTRPRDLILIGHNRAASGGSVISTANAHPHCAGNIVMVHNGTLQGHSRLDGIKSAAVDSIALVNAIAELGIDEAISRTHGSYAIIYYDTEAMTLNVLRNSERPLYFCPDLGNGRLFIASEQGMLKWILARHSVAVETVASLKINTLMTIPVDNKTNLLPDPAFRIVEGPKVHQHWRNNNWTDFVEEQVRPLVETYLQPSRQLPALVQSKFDKKRETRILKTLKKDVGISVEGVQYFHNKKAGEVIGVKVCNFTESKNKEWPFTMEAENPLYQNVQFRFRVKTLEQVEAIMEHVKQLVTIRRILKFAPEVTNGPSSFIVWVSDPEPWPSADELLESRENDEIAEAIVELDSGNPAHQNHKDEAWKEEGSRLATPQDKGIVLH